MKELIDNKILVEDLKTIILATKEQVAISVNSSLTLLYWNIGKKIVEVEQNGETKAKYGSNLISELSKELKALVIVQNELKNDRERFIKKDKFLSYPIEKIDLELELLKNQKNFCYPFCSPFVP